MENNQRVLLLWAIFAILLIFLAMIVNIVGVSPTGEAVKVSYQCSDSKDNDLDGKCDYAGCYITVRKVKTWYPADPDCTSLQDTSEACTPTAEICDNKDNNCNGQIDENLAEQCGVSDIGECQYGTKTCSAGVWGSCVGNVDPATEICDLKDNDCNGLSDEGCNCTNGASQACGTDVGECVAGTQACVSGDWAACLNQVLPTTEICDAKDNDCDGSTDEGCNCVDGQTRVCGTDVGECVAGTQTCTNGDWAACVGSIGPATEICDLKDNDCDSSVDEGVCIANSCLDSDNGRNATVLGYTSGYFNSTAYNNTDFCYNNVTVREYYCSSVYSYSTYMGCNGNGTTTCLNGICI